MGMRRVFCNDPEETSWGAGPAAPVPAPQTPHPLPSSLFPREKPCFSWTNASRLSNPRKCTNGPICRGKESC